MVPSTPIVQSIRRLILLVGQSEDPHVSAVALRLKERGREFAILDTFSTRSRGISFHASNSVSLVIAGSHIALSDINSIWWRQKQKFIVPKDSVSELYDYVFMHREWNQILDAIYEQLRGINHLNDRQTEQAASSKIYQMRCAELIGFRIPNTLISNDLAAVKKFISRCPDKRVIFKTLTPYMTPEGMAAYTTQIDTSLLENNEINIRTTPGIFQNFVEKSFELRVTVVGNKVHAARVESGYSEESSVDWRRDIFSDIYTATSLDTKLTNMILRLHKMLGLGYGAYDLIIDRSGDVVFLEVNPAGQWMWLEDRLGLPISASIADYLMERRQPSPPRVDRA